MAELQTDKPDLQTDRPDLQTERMAVSRRDPAELRRRFTGWLDSKLPGLGVEVTSVDAPATNGMSSETLLVEASWQVDGVRTPQRLVVRLAPATDDVPVFPVYDLALQYEAIQLVEERSIVPVPHPHWLELDTSILGGEFFVMDRIDGRVPPDVMPYTFEGWVLDATPEERRALQDASVEVLAHIHGIPLSDEEREHFSPDAPGDTPLRRHVNHWRSYYDWVRGEDTYPVLERAFDWIEANWPGDEGEPVLSWGDARIGNTMYDEFTPVAVLDWEMVGIGPRGIDLGWFLFIHTFFQDITEEFELAGLPDMFVASEVLETYEQASGTTVPDLRFYEVWGALRHGIVMARVHARRVHFGEAEPVATPDEAVMHRVRLAEMISAPLR